MMDDWSQFPAADAAEAEADAPRDAPQLYDGIAAPPGEVFIGWGVDGTGHRYPQFGPPDAAAPQHDATALAPAQIAGAGAAEATPGEQADWSQFPEVPKEHSWIDELGIGARAVAEGAGGLAQSLDAPHVIMNKIADLTGLPIGSPEISQIADMVGLPTPTTDSEKLASSAIKGASAAAPLALAGGPLIPALVGGASAGASGEEARQAGYGPVAQIAASLAGGGAAGLATGIPRAAAGLLPSNRTVLTPTMKAFVDEKVPALAADVGGIGARMFTGIGNMTLGGIPIGIAARKSVEAARTLRTRIADTIGSPFRTIEGQSDSTGAGLAAQSGLKKVLGEGGIKQQRGEALYTAIPIAPQTPSVLNNTRTALNELTTGLESNPELSKLWAENPRLQATLDAISEPQYPDLTKFGYGKGTSPEAVPPIAARAEIPGLSWGDLQRLRSIVGRIIGRPGLSENGDQIAALRKVYGALSEDMRATAAAQGPKASAAFTRANNYWRGLETRRAQILKPLLGDKMDLHGSQAFRQIEQWSTKDQDVFALARALRSMPEQEANDVRATLFDRLGTATKGTQDGGGLVFSPSSFVTHWNGLSSRAKAVLFPGADYRQSIDNLVRIASAQKGAQQFANVSKTGNALNGIALVKLLVSNPLVFAGSALTELGAGAMLASPKVARWLASAPAKPNAPAMLAHINRLSTIAATEPAIANEVLHLQERLAAAFAQEPMRAAADHRNGGKR